MATQPVATKQFPARDVESRSDAGNESGRRIAAFAAGSVLVVGAVAALHNIYRSGDSTTDLISWAGLLLLAMTALGGGIKLALWGAKPVTDAGFAAVKAKVPESVQAVAASGAVIAGALGMWWVFRGGYAAWWQHFSGEAGWSLALGVGQMLVAVLAGAGLFTGGKYLTGLTKEVLTDAGVLLERDRTSGSSGASEGVWHPGLVAALIGGGLGLVLLTAGITPRLYVWITGPDVFPAVGAITFVLLWAIGSNLGWWKGLGGLYKWATDASQKAGATAGVVAVLMFSAGGLGLGWFTPATVPLARAACPPDCGGPGGSDGPPGGGQMFQPPSQGGPQMPDYQGGVNQPPMDQNGSVSIYNTQAPSISNNGVNGSNGQQSSQQGWDQPAHGTQPPNYQNATPYTQGPGKPNPEYNPGSQGGQTNPDTQGGNQGATQKQPPANQGQQPGQNQPPQNNSGQQPNQSSDQQKIDDLTRQLQDQQQQSGQDRQRLDDLTKQLQQNKQNQKQQQLPKFPSKDDKKDRDQQEQQDRDKQSGNNDLAALLMGAASTRRRKQDEQEQGPDTQALGQDASQAAQGLPGDVQTYVQSGQQIGQASGQAAQGFGSAAQAGASLASSAQSGAVNPQDALTLVQGVSQGIQGTADAVNAGSQIVKTAQKEADQAAQAVGDANPQLKPQMQQLTQLNDQASQVTDLVGQGAQITSQGAGAVNTVSSLGAGGLPEGSATSVSAPQGVVPSPPAPNPGTSGGIAQMNPAPQAPAAQPQGMPSLVNDPGGQGRVDAPSIVKGIQDTPPRQSVDVSSLNRVGVTQQKTFADPHVPSINDSFEKVAPTKGDSFDLGVYSNGQMWTGDYYETAGADRGGKGGMYRIPASSDGKTATGNPVRVAPPANNPDGSPRDPSSRLLPTGKADLGGGNDLVFASQTPSPGATEFVSNFTWAYNAANPDAAPTAINGISQLSGAATPDGRMVAVGNMGANGPRHAWLTPQVGSEGWLDPAKWTDFGSVSGGGMRENQVFALPGGGYGLLDSDGPIGMKVVQTPQQLASVRMTPLISNSNDNPLPNDPFLSSAANQLLQPYGPEVISVVPNGNGSTLTFLASQWVTDPTRAYRTILYTVNIGPS
ncbi:hypothetical protein [Mycobacteroides salmoniphilum]|uniref:hypothetical protein n=1 Tax=Mycobacteroides salmoniphilum TaxID=404941 RepID=UPI001F20962B|nr:hypothetical protein [Mycobacteroides salmoniphilum]